MNIDRELQRSKVYPAPVVLRTQAYVHISKRPFNKLHAKQSNVWQLLMTIPGSSIDIQTLHYETHSLHASMLHRCNQGRQSGDETRTQTPIRLRFTNHLKSWIMNRRRGVYIPLFASGIRGLASDRRIGPRQALGGLDMDAYVHWNSTVMWLPADRCVHRTLRRY